MMADKAFLIECKSANRTWYLHNCNGKLAEYDQISKAKAALTRVRNKHNRLKAEGPNAAGPDCTYSIYPIYY